MNQEHETQHVVSLLTSKEVAQRLKISLRQLRRLKKQPGFPEAVCLGNRSTRWRESDISGFIERL